MKEMFTKGTRQRQGKESDKKNERKDRWMRKIKKELMKKRKIIYSEEKKIRKKEKTRTNKQKTKTVKLSRCSTDKELCFSSVCTSVGRAVCLGALLAA